MSEQSNIAVKLAEYLCSECGKGAITMDKPCVFCGSVRVVTVAFAKQHFGEDYYKTAFDLDEPPTVLINAK